MKKKPLIFISHSSKNKDQVAKIADLLRSINLSPRRDIFVAPYQDMEYQMEPIFLTFKGTVP